MFDWFDVAAVETLEEGMVQLVDMKSAEVAVFNIDGGFYAIEDVCTHDGGMLTEGNVEGYEIECPRHGACFDLRTGKVTAPPACEDVTTYGTCVHAGMIKVRDERPR